MALFVENQKPSDAINGNCPSSYRLFGDFWLEEPKKYLSQEALNRLRALEPYLRDLEIQFQQGKPPVYPEPRVLSNPSSAVRLEKASVQCQRRVCPISRNRIPLMEPT